MQHPVTSIDMRKMILLCLVTSIVQGLAEPRKPKDEADLQYWLGNMITHHQFLMEEIVAATGLPPEAIAQAIRRGAIPSRPKPKQTLRVLPYPGARHPRIGFLDGAINPQRETKISVFTPWDPISYVVVDVPEALWSNLGLTYLAHTHIDTVWSNQGIALPSVEWERRDDGTLFMSRTLPNKIRFGTAIFPGRDHVAMVMWLYNGSDAPLSDLRVQNCVMLKGAAGFTDLTNENKTLAEPFVACESSDGGRWIITAWEPCHRAWANAPVPCLHADPKFPDTAPGEMAVLNGWLSFFEGTDVKAAFTEIDQRWKRRSLAEIRNLSSSSEQQEP